MSESPLTSVLRAMHPASDETLLLRALLLTDQRGADAWQQFTALHGDLTELFRTDKGELRRLSPLLARSLKTNNAVVDARLWTVLRTASMREGLRADIYGNVLNEVVSTLRSADIPFLVIRGAAIGSFAYRDVSARHTHDIDLLVGPDDIARCISALQETGYMSEPARPAEAGVPAVPSLLHKTSLPVRLHTSLFELNCYSIDSAALLRDAHEISLGAHTAPVLPPEHMLLSVLVHASYSLTRHTLQWVPDAYHLAPMVSDWHAFLRVVERSQLSVVVDAQVGYLEREIAPIVPSEFRERLRDLATRATSVERDFALYGARLGARDGTRSLFRQTRSPMAKSRLAAWLALPSVEYLRWASRAQAALGAPADADVDALGRHQLLGRRAARMFRNKKARPG